MSEPDIRRLRDSRSSVERLISRRTALGLLGASALVHCRPLWDELLDFATRGESRGAPSLSRLLDRSGDASRHMSYLPSI